jgi:hypothetical protein
MTWIKLRPRWDFVSVLDSNMKEPLIRASQIEIPVNSTSRKPKFIGVESMCISGSAARFILILSDQAFLGRISTGRHGRCVTYFM